jgi:hypothetical protein
MKNDEIESGFSTFQRIPFVSGGQWSFLSLLKKQKRPSNPPPHQKKQNKIAL